MPSFPWKTLPSATCYVVIRPNQVYALTVYKVNQSGMDANMSSASIEKSGKVVACYMELAYLQATNSFLDYTQTTILFPSLARI